METSEDLRLADTAFADPLADRTTAARVRYLDKAEKAHADERQRPGERTRPSVKFIDEAYTAQTKMIPEPEKASS